MGTINSISYGILGAFNVGAVFRVLFCLIMKNSDPQSEQIMTKRIKNILIAVAVVNSIFGASQLAMSYWG